MTDQQLRDEAMTLFMAGHETTAITLAWTWYLLASHPEAEARLHAELDAVLGGRPPTLADLPRLRLHGDDRHRGAAALSHRSGWSAARRSSRSSSAATASRRARRSSCPSGSIHRDPRWFDDPESFRPERWADGLQEQLPRYAYFPFGGGPRICIGNNFALMEAALLLATIARKYRLDSPRTPWSPPSHR